MFHLATSRPTARPTARSTLQTMREEVERLMLLHQTHASEAEKWNREKQQSEAAALEREAVDTAKAQAAINAAILASQQVRPSTE
jgi:hypothetical protein